MRADTKLPPFFVQSGFGNSWTIEKSMFPDPLLFLLPQLLFIFSFFSYFSENILDISASLCGVLCCPVGPQSTPFDWQHFASARDKLRLLDLDPVMVHLAPFYSTTGRPALNQPQIIRSLTLMLHLGVTSLTRWLNRLASDDLLAFLIGCSPLFPPATWLLLRFYRSPVAPESRFWTPGQKRSFSFNHF